MSDPFRDDKDAAIARAEALERELAKVKEERDALAEKLEDAAPKAEKLDRLEESEQREKERRAAESKAAKARNARDKEEAKRRRAEEAKAPAMVRERRHLIWGWSIGIGLTIGLGLLFGIPSYLHALDHRKWVLADAERTAKIKTWKAVLRWQGSFESATQFLDTAVQLDAAKLDPRGGERRGEPPWYGLRESIDAATLLGAGTDIPLATRDAFTRYVAAATALRVPYEALHAYYAKADWRDDNYAGAPKLWADVRPLLAAAYERMHDVYRIAEQGLVDYMQQVAETQPLDSPQRWRIELGIRVLDLRDTMRSGATPTRISRTAANIVDDAKAAPIEIRRALRSDGIDEIGQGTLRRPSTNALFDPIDDEDNAPFAGPGAEPNAGCDAPGGD